MFPNQLGDHLGLKGQRHSYYLTRHINLTRLVLLVYENSNKPNIL